MRCSYHESLMTHAMVFTAVDTDPEDESRTTAWRVENSWGPDLGDGGFFRSALRSRSCAAPRGAAPLTRLCAQ